MARARQGREDACRELMRRYRPRVFGLIHRLVGNRELAEDLTQDTFVKAFGALDQRRTDGKPAAWMLRIANNTAVDYIRRRRPDSTHSPHVLTPGRIDEGGLPAPTPGVTTTRRARRREAIPALEQAIRQLRPAYRRCVLLYHVDERSYDEIADAMDLPVGTVKSHLHRARKELRRTFGRFP